MRHRDRAVDLVGVDREPQMVTQARARCAAYPSVTIVQADLVGFELLPADLVLTNLEDELRLPQTFDLAICIEVIEHLSPARGESLVADLCRCAPHVLFGAAIPGQTGPNHLNTRWPS